MPGMSGVIKRQLENDHEIRSRHISARLRGRDDKDRHAIETAAKRAARSLARQKAERLVLLAYRSPESKRTVSVGVFLVNQQPTRNRSRYYVSGNGTLHKKGPFDHALSVVDICKLSVSDREDLAGILGVTLPVAD